MMTTTQKLAKAAGELDCEPDSKFTATNYISRHDKNRLGNGNRKDTNAMASEFKASAGSTQGPYGVPG